MLVAIAIPVFTSQLEKSRESVDLSNARSAYAEMMVYVLDGSTGTLDSSVPGCVITESSGTYTATITGMKQTVAGWATTMTDVNIGGVAYTAADWDTVTGGATGKCTITYTPKTGAGESGGDITIVWA